MAAAMQIGPNVLRALAILRDKGPIRPAWFAHLWFPRDHPGWSRSCKCGPYGSTRGSGLVMWAGGYLGRLCRTGWAEHRGWDVGVALTTEGKKVLREQDLKAPRAGKRT